MMLKERFVVLFLEIDGIKHIISSYFFGRYFCKAQNPNCKECHLYDMCKDKIKESKR